MKIDAKQIVLALPAAFLLLSADRLTPDRRPPPLAADVRWETAATMLAPVYEGRDGRPGGPLNLVFVATPSSLRAALTEAGWVEIPTTARGALAAGLLPMRDERLIGRRENMNWARPAPLFSERRHFRLWFTGMVDVQGRAYWWGSARCGDSPDLDRERDFTAASLAGSRYLDSAALIALPQIPRAGDDAGRAYRTDGRAAVIVLKRILEPPAAKAGPKTTAPAAAAPTAPRPR